MMAVLLNQNQVCRVQAQMCSAISSVYERMLEMLIIRKQQRLCYLRWFLFKEDFNVCILYIEREELSSVSNYVNYTKRIAMDKCHSANYFESYWLFSLADLLPFWFT